MVKVITIRDFGVELNGDIYNLDFENPPGFSLDIEVDGEKQTIEVELLDGFNIINEYQMSSEVGKEVYEWLDKHFNEIVGLIPDSITFCKEWEVED